MTEDALREGLEGQFWVMQYSPIPRAVNIMPPPAPLEPAATVIKLGMVEGREPTLRELLDVVASVHGMTPRELIYGGKWKELVAARWVFFAVARRMGYSLPQIGACAQTHHTTVLHGLRSAQKKHPSLDADCRRVAEELGKTFPDMRRII